MHMNQTIIILGITSQTDGYSVTVIVSVREVMKERRRSQRQRNTATIAIIGE